MMVILKNQHPTHTERYLFKTYGLYRSISNDQIESIYAFMQVQKQNSRQKSILMKSKWIPTNLSFLKKCQRPFKST